MLTFYPDILLNSNSLAAFQCFNKYFLKKLHICYVQGTILCSTAGEKEGQVMGPSLK